MEILDLFDANGNPLHKTIVRASRKLNHDEYIKIVTIWINCKGKYLIQKTSKEKHSEYAVSGGHIPTGVNPTDQAVIEISEELGVTIDRNQLKYLGRILRGQVFFETYLLEDDTFDGLQLTLQESEVESVLWLYSSEIEEMISREDFRISSALQYEKLIKNL